MLRSAMDQEEDDVVDYLNDQFAPNLQSSILLRKSKICQKRKVEK